MIPDFRLYYKVTVTKTILYYRKADDTDQRNRIESPEINSYSYAQLTYDKGGKTTQQIKDSCFKKRCWENWTATCKGTELEHLNTIYKNKLTTD